MTNQNPCDVEIGQVWASTDKREAGRKIKIIAIEDGRAAVRSATGLGMISYIRLDRFKPGSTGFVRIR